MITLADINEAYRNASNKERQEFINLILPDLKESPIFKFAIEAVIATSELKILPRLTQVEMVTGKYHFEDFEEHEPTLPERIEYLEENIQSNHIVIKEPETVIPETKTEARAVFLVQYLENEVKERNGELFLNGNELKEFLIKVAPEKNPDCAIKEGQNLRKIKKDVLAKAKKLFPNQLFLFKNKNGRHETRVFFKPLQTVTK